MLKFRINILLGELHPTQRRIVLVDLEQVLKVSRTRLNRIRNAKTNEPVNLKDWQLHGLASYFKVPMEEILNSPKISENGKTNTHTIPAGH
jgi:transcriptional regulator with XRE-family HTH domain